MFRFIDILVLVRQVLDLQTLQDVKNRQQGTIPFPKNLLSVFLSLYFLCLCPNPTFRGGQPTRFLWCYDINDYIGFRPDFLDKG